MPFARSRAAEDSRSEASVNGIQKPSTATTIDKRRSVITSSNQPAATNANGAHAHEGIEGVSTEVEHSLSGSLADSPGQMGWDDIPSNTLHSYRLAYRLDVPSASRNFNNTVLSTTIGKKTASRAGGKARCSRSVLATAVRKNFNAQPIVENDVIVNFLYSVKNQDKRFRLRFTPTGTKRDGV